MQLRTCAVQFCLHYHHSVCSLNALFCRGDAQLCAQKNDVIPDSSWGDPMILCPPLLGYSRASTGLLTSTMLLPSIKMHHDAPSKAPLPDEDPAPLQWRHILMGMQPGHAAA